MEQISRKIKELRLKHDMTLKELSDATGLSVSFLSQVERGSTSLALTSLKKIADTFNVPMYHFFEEPENWRFLLKKEEQKPFQITGSDYTYIRLTGKFSNMRLEPMIVRVPPCDYYREKTQHSGEEFFYVLSGKIVFKIGKEEFQLTAGDSIHYPSEVPHAWKNPGKEDAVLLCVLTPTIF